MQRLPYQHATNSNSQTRAIADFQGVQFQFAELAVQLEAARLMVYNA
ncbi:MAG: hypothetical protein HC814_07215, partial [Rhodobacteraceae bacterium]|nr:hypothetical protein [Paracoccaceae bacterium]